MNDAASNHNQIAAADSDDARRWIGPPRDYGARKTPSNRRWEHRFSPVLHRNRNAIERMFSRLKDFRRRGAGRSARGLPRRTAPSPSPLYLPSWGEGILGIASK